MVPQHFNIRAIFVHIACIAALLTGVSALAQSTTTTPATTSTVAQNSEAGKWTVFVAPYTFHFSDATKESTSEPDGIKHSYVWLVGAEKMLDEKYFAGASFFSNSFGQPSQYIYFGAKWRPADTNPKLFTKLSGGIIHGYKPPYDKKIPINTKSGWGLGVVPSIGWDFNKNMSAQLNLLGTAGMMFQMSFTTD
jgi:hypothetical protein